MAVSVKAAGGAVPRNRLKRLIREAFRTRKTDLPAVDVVVIARPAAGKASNDEIGRSLARHWERISRQCAASSSS